MNYELAKKLKDAGFPQDGIGQFIDVKLASPTLSELIEACGDKFRGLSKRANWRAQDVMGIEEFGDTPEEAVANLYLALNNK